MEWGCKTKWYEKMELAEANLGAGPRICVIVHYFEMLQLNFSLK